MILKNYKEIHRVYQQQAWTNACSSGSTIDKVSSTMKDYSGNAVDIVLPWGWSSGNNYSIRSAMLGLTGLCIFDGLSLLNDPSKLVVNSYYTGKSGYSCQSIIYYGGIVVLGSGNTPVSFSDYALDNTLTSEIEYSSVGTSAEYDEDNNLVMSVYVSGCAKSNVTIKEAGIVKTLHNSNNVFNRDINGNSIMSYTKNVNSTANGSPYVNCFKNVLMVRELLDEPIVLSAGDTFNVTIKVKM